MIAYNTRNTLIARIISKKNWMDVRTDIETSKLSSFSLIGFTIDRGRCKTLIECNAAIKMC